MWTLGLLLFIAGYLVMKMIEGTFKRIKTPVYPSDTEIDRAIPPEILEQIFINLDYKSLKSCNQVSKYWKYLSSRKKLSLQVCTREIDTSARITADETLSALYEHLGLNSYLIDGLNWLKYSDSYDPEWRIQDQLLARKRGKILLDLDWKSISAIKPTLKKSQHKWFAKFRCEVTSTYYNNMRILAPISDNDITFKHKTIHIIKPMKLPLRVNAVCEVIVDLAEIDYHPITVYHIRYIDANPRSLFGLDWDPNSLFSLGVVLFTPCLLADYWNSSETMQQRGNFWLAPLNVILTGLFFLWDDFQKLKRSKPNRNIYFWLEPAMLLVLMIFWDWTLELGLLVGCLMGFSIYISCIRQLFDMNFPLAKEVTTIGALLWLLILDWSLLAESVRSGVIIRSISYNTLLFIIAASISLLISGIGYTLTTDRPFFTNVFWDFWQYGRWRDYGKLFLIMLFVTLYAPNATWKLQRQQ